MGLVEIQEVRKVYRTLYGPVVALDGVSMQIGKGVTALIGPNGAGKTTLIKVILGLVRPTSGTVRVLGRPPGRMEGISYLPEKPFFPRGVTVREIVKFVSKVRGVPPEEMFSLLSELGMEAWDRRVGALSAGMLQKLGIALALTSSSELIILDEPTANLDPVWRKRVLEMIREKGEGAGVLVSTHILTEIEKVADAATFLVNGEVVFSGSLVPLLSKKRYLIRLRDGRTLETESLENFVMENVEDIDVVRRTLGDVFEESVTVVHE